MHFRTDCGEVLLLKAFTSGMFRPEILLKTETFIWPSSKMSGTGGLVKPTVFGIKKLKEHFAYLCIHFHCI